MRWDMWFQNNSWKEMDRLIREMDELGRRALPGFARQRKASEFPAVNMWNNDEEVIFTAQLPGIDPKDLNINALEDTVSIEGKREPAAEKDSAYHRQERMEGEFKRVFRLPYKITPDKVEARYEKGILKIILPRAEKDKPKKISVSV